MNRQLKRWSALAAFIIVPALASTAFGQEINRYDEQDGGESQDGGSGVGQQMVYPGQPMPEKSNNSQQGRQQQAQQQQEGDGKKSDEDGGMEASYEVRMYGGEQKEKSREELEDRKPDQMYRGIIPGTRETVDHLEGARKKSETEGPNLITWLGFQAKNDMSRVFVQTARTPEYQIDTEDGGQRLVVTIRDADFAAKNFSRQIDAKFFDRNPKMIHARKKDGTVRIRIELRDSESPEVDADGKYLRLDFKSRVPDPENDDQTS